MKTSLLSLLFSFVLALSFYGQTILVASTPGDDQIKSLLAISTATKVDFIRWNLSLDDNKKSFVLDLVFGESQPNTLGFKNGGEHKTLRGDWRISHDNGTIYHLKAAGLADEIKFVKLDENIFHLLTHENRLMIGTEGWSYTLNRKNPVNNMPASLPSSWMSSDTAKTIVLTGRTPCIDLAVENSMTVSPGCFKLKWELILNKDPKTGQPTTYILRRSQHRQSDITGKWIILQGIPTNPKAVIYQLDPDKPKETISFFLGDENVAFFLRKDFRLFTGNEDFSFTLNKTKK